MFDRRCALLMPLIQSAAPARGKFQCTRHRIRTCDPWIKSRIQLVGVLYLQSLAMLACWNARCQVKFEDIKRAVSQACHNPALGTLDRFPEGRRKRLMIGDISSQDHAVKGRKECEDCVTQVATALLVHRSLGQAIKLPQSFSSSRVLALCRLREYCLPHTR
jgi:hypothetical protein